MSGKWDDRERKLDEECDAHAAVITMALIISAVEMMATVTMAVKAGLQDTTTHNLQITKRSIQ